MSKLTNCDLLKPFAESIFAKATALNHFIVADLITDRQRARFLESISDDIKKCTNFFSPMASQAACEKASELGIKIFEMHWHNQCRDDPGRRTFHWEHMVPVRTIREECRKASTASEVLDILTTRLCIVWILKSEDAELTRLGYRSKRDDPKAAYREAGITLVPLPLG